MAGVIRERERDLLSLDFFFLARIFKDLYIDRAQKIYMYLL